MGESRVGEIRQRGLDLAETIRTAGSSYKDERLGGIVDFITAQEQCFQENDPNELNELVQQVITDIQTLEAGGARVDPTEESTVGKPAFSSEPPREEDSESAKDPILGGTSLDPTIEGIGSTTPAKTMDAGRADDPMIEEDKPKIDLGFLD
jgi:hypothetical protein